MEAEVELEVEAEAEVEVGLEAEAGAGVTHITVAQGAGRTPIHHTRGVIQGQDPTQGQEVDPIPLIHHGHGRGLDHLRFLAEEARQVFLISGG